MEGNGSEAKQLGSLYWDVNIGKSTKTLRLCRQLLSSVRERHCPKDDQVVHGDMWNHAARYPVSWRELGVLEVIYKDSNDEQSPVNPDEVQWPQTLWQKF